VGNSSGLDNYVKAVGDFRFWPAVARRGFLVIWVVTLTVLVTLLASSTPCASGGFH
jgi:multiple sugar transport system permease protein